MTLDPINQLTRETMQVCLSKNANFNSSVIDLQNYIGNVEVIVTAGVLTAGDSTSTMTATAYDSADNITFAATSYSSAFTNIAAVKTIGIDTREVSRYLKLVCTMAGGNTPTRPVAAELIGTKQSQ